MRVKRCVSIICLLAVVSLIVPQRTASLAYHWQAPFPTPYYATTTDEVISILMDARKNHVEALRISVDPTQVQMKNDDPTRCDLHSSIYEHFDYRYNGGIYNSLDLDVHAGPIIDWEEPDKDNPSNTIYAIEFLYNDNPEELLEADNKLRTIMSSFDGQSDGDKVISLVKWMKENLPAEKRSSTGYPRGCNGIHGALFGDGTGFCCTTYATTIQRALELEGIESYVLGSASAYDNFSHCFNIIKIDGAWYSLDYTKLDQIQEGKVLLGTKSFKSILIEKYVPSFKFAEKNYGDTSGDPEQPSVDPTPDPTPTDDPSVNPTEEPEVDATVPAVKIRLLKNIPKKTIVVKWTKKKNLEGYDLEYSTDKAFKTSKHRYFGKNMTSERIKKLKKKKTYYVRVRGFKNTNDVTTWGKWSSVKKIKIKR